MSDLAVTPDHSSDCLFQRPPTERNGRLLLKVANLFANVVLFSALFGGAIAILSGWLGATVVSGDSMESTIASGDLVLTRPQPNYSVGEVVVFVVPSGQPGAGSRVIHRITGGDASGFETTGDNRDGADIWTPGDGDIIGSHVLTVPAVGTLIVWLRAPLVIAFLIGLASFRLALRAAARGEVALERDSRLRPDEGPGAGADDDDSEE